MKVCREIEIEDFAQILRCGAKEKWDEADDDQRELVWLAVNDLFANRSDIPTESEINDFVWFGCDEIFFPENDCDGDEDESNSDDDYEYEDDGV